LRNRLKYALTGKETNQICMEKLVQVDGKVRTDPNFPAGFMDVVEMPKSNDQFRLIFDTKGRFVLHSISDEEKAYKLCKVVKKELTLKKVPYIVTHDGRTIRYPDPLISVRFVFCPGIFLISQAMLTVSLSHIYEQLYLNIYLYPIYTPYTPIGR
jgi:ribosomal protein S4E